MPVTIFEAGKRRPLRADDLEGLLEPHPVAVAEVVRELFEQGDDAVRIEQLPRLLVPSLQAATRRQSYQVLVETDPAASQAIDVAIAALAEATELPVYRFIKPPAELTSDSPVELGGSGATRVYSAYGKAEPAVMQRGNAALAALVELRYQVPEGEDRSEAMAKLARLLSAVASAARSFPIVGVRPVERYLQLVPGELPPLLSRLLESFVQSARPLEVLDVDLLHRIGKSLGHPERGPVTGRTLAEVAAFYTGIDDRLWPLLQEMPGVRQRLEVGEDAGWWLEGESLSRPIAPQPGDLSTGAGEHLIIPGLTPRITVAPPGVPPVPISAPLGSAAPIVLVLSDLHLGQGYWDNADEGYPELEAALVEMLDAWAARVAAHRGQYGAAQPAYLVLNGDVLDFWSADLRELPGGGDRFELDVENVGGAPRLTPAVAAARMRRILDNHPDFFKRIRRWVDSFNLNFVIYVCGNHDDHLERFGLGGALADELGGRRGAFAARSLHFPELCTIIEHGHRTDVFNSWQGDGTDVGMYGSLGEILVATMVNPAERGGAAALNIMHAVFNNVLEANGIDADFLDDLQEIYDHFRRCYEVEPSVYEGCMGAIDNIDTGGLEEAVADYTGRELVERNRVRADAADVSDLDDDLLELKAVWVRNEYQDLIKQLLAPSLARVLPPVTQAWLVDKVFAGDHAGKLGFGPRGLFGDSQRRIHLVGHTHRPEATSPPIDGRQVWAQHVNTGTGQDTWNPYDDSQRDNVDLKPLVPGWFLWGAVEESEDRLNPVPKSNYCILQVVPFFVGQSILWRMQIEAGEYRTLQTHRPEDTPQRVQGGLMPKGANTTFL